MFLHRFKYNVLDYIYKTRALLVQKEMLTCLQWKVDVFNPFGKIHM